MLISASLLQPLIDLSVLPLDSSIIFMTSCLSADQNPLDGSVSHTLLPSGDQTPALDALPHQILTTMGDFVLPNLSLLHSQLTMFQQCVSSLVQQHASLVSSLYLYHIMVYLQLCKCTVKSVPLMHSW